MNDERDSERQSGQHPPIHEQAETTAKPRHEDTNEYADDHVKIVQPDGSDAPPVEEE